MYPQAHLCIKGKSPDGNSGTPMTATPAARLFFAPTPRSTRLGVLLACTLLSLASACSRVPELEDRLPADLRSQPYPDLLPLETALSDEPLPEDESAALSEALDARAEALRRRAEELRRRQF